MRPDAIYKSVVSVDAVDSTSLPTAAKREMRATIYRVVDAAFEEARITADDRYREDRGDGILATVEARVPVERLLGTWVQTVYWGLRHSPTLTGGRTVRLRVAFTGGTVGFDGKGLVGRAVDFAVRLRDSEPVRQAMRADPGCPLALVIPDALYQDGVAGGGDHIEPEKYVETEVSVLGRTQTAWLYTPGGTGIGRPAGDGAAGDRLPGSGRTASSTGHIFTAKKQAVFIDPKIDRLDLFGRRGER